MTARRFVSPSRMVRATLIAGLALQLAGCETVSSTVSSLNPFGASSKSSSDLGKDEPAEALFNDGLVRLQNRNFDGAARKFADVDKQYPYTSWSKRSLLLTTYANYENRNYEDSISNGRRFVQLYPADKDAAYAQYLVGMSYFNQMPDVTRDQERSQRALLAMDELLNKWPTSEYAADARQRVAIARDQLAGKEMEIGRYYLNQRNYPGSVNRFREVLTKYQTTRHTEEALMRLTEAYMAMGVVQEAQTAAAVLGHNFPDSPWYKDAFKLLESGGLSPRENQDSYISRARREGFWFRAKAFCRTKPSGLGERMSKPWSKITAPLRGEMKKGRCSSAAPRQYGRIGFGSPHDPRSLFDLIEHLPSFFWEAALGVMDRLVLDDVQWGRIVPHVIGDERTRGSSGRDNRMFVEAVLWIVRTGCPWRDLPEVFGDWNSVFRRFSRWSAKGVWWRIFAAM
eukprot:gene37251-48699_t